MESISNFSEKIKGSIATHRNAIVLSLLFIAVGIGAYSLGILAGIESVAVHQEYSRSQIVADQWVEYLEKENKNARFVASKNGSNYYARGCSSANRIKEENRIYFQTQQEAEALGFKRGRC